MTSPDININGVSEWLGRAWPRGLLVVGGIGPDGEPFSQGLSEQCPFIHSEAWSAINDAVAQLDAYGCGNGSSAWVFETAIMWVVRRSDGGWAGVIAPRELPESVRAAVKARLAEFTA